MNIFWSSLGTWPMMKPRQRLKDLSRRGMLNSPKTSSTIIICLFPSSRACPRSPCVEVKGAPESDPLVESVGGLLACIWKSLNKSHRDRLVILMTHPNHTACHASLPRPRPLFFSPFLPRCGNALFALYSTLASKMNSSQKPLLCEQNELS